ncbi:N-acetyltransferase ESCO2-like [Macrosteles quadrilineatus]|uniref:N-acetyltransferase ESCO2-like n=1 Tax=Macrosteles quadrilineatus TaxID=74068 RepID=UPI0023E132D6|nr:N-acetyltransferase ESCO2-like [Macrosteles quadrilineatus]
MNVAAFSPRKLQMLNHCSPRGSARKRSLFPSNSPQSNDLGLISELTSSDSETYSPSPPSPGSCRDQNSPLRPLFSNRLNFDDILPPTKSLRHPTNKSFGKENMERGLSARKSPKKSARKAFLEKMNFGDRYTTILSEDNDELAEGFKLKKSENFTTPKKNTLNTNKNVVRRSPRSASKKEAVIKPVSFYGSNMAPVLATNQTNRIGGVKCVFRPDTHQSRAKTKLNFEVGRHSKKRERSKSKEAQREAKRRKAIFTGVHHAIPRPTKHTSPTLVEKKQMSIREKARNVTDLSRTPYGVKKENKKTDNVWDYTMRFTKPLRYDESPYLGVKRKFFKTTVRESPDQFKLCVSPGSSGDEAPPVVHRKRKLLDTRKSYLDRTSPLKPNLSASDICELIEDYSDKLQEKPEVDDILLRLEEDDENEKEAERQKLMNILEDSPIKIAAIDTLSDCTASLDINSSPNGCTRFSLEEDSSNKEEPKRYFSVFNSKSSGSNSGSGGSGKRKWRGVGESQMQIDAGQKWYGPHKCHECGMLYQAGEAEDELQHQHFHNSLNLLKHTGWKNEKVVAYFNMDYIIEVSGDHPRPWQQKALEVMAVVDKHLGMTVETPTEITNQKVYMYIADKRIVGFVATAPLSLAYRMEGSENDVDLCSEQTFPVKCGISRMWTMYSQRRRGIASKMIDTVRRNFMYGYILRREDLAFSIPTPDGKKFAANYMDSPNYFVYTGFNF